MSLNFTPVEISDFAEIRHESWETGGTYSAYDKGSGEEVGRLTYMIALSEPHQLIMTSINVRDDYRRRKVATALISAMRTDYPDTLWDTGPRNESAVALYNYLVSIEPEEVAEAEMKVDE